MNSHGFILQNSPEIVLSTPWSQVIRFSTKNEDFYLKKTPAFLSLEPKIIRFLADQLHANVPTVIACNQELHCFLMKDAGKTLRQHLKNEYQTTLMCEAIRLYTNIQRLTESHGQSFLTLGVPDWRLDQLPKYYDDLINQTSFLKEENMTDTEIERLHALTEQVKIQCQTLLQYPIPATIVQPDFNTNNILIDPHTNKMTLIDLGEIVISHPFFSLDNFLYQAIIHHGIEKLDPAYEQLLNLYLVNWAELVPKKQLLNCFALVKRLTPIYGALAYYRLMNSVDLKALKSYYANRPNQLAVHLREYIAAS